MITHKDGIPVIDGDAPIPLGGYQLADDVCGMATSGGYVVKWAVLEAGHAVVQHVHPHAHATLVIDGTVEVWQGDRLLGRYGPMQMAHIAEMAPHQIVAITRARFACIHYLPEEL